MTELPAPRPCNWPPFEGERGCGQPVLDVITKAGKHQVLDAKPVKAVVVGSMVTTHAHNDSVVLMLEPDPHPTVALVTVVVDSYIVHQATCRVFKAWNAAKARARASR